MVLYYTKGRKTKVFAEALAEVTEYPIQELKTSLNDKGHTAFIFRSLTLAISGKAYPVSNMPEDMPDEIFVCAPVWAGRPAAPALYFLQNADLTNKKVNMLLTCASATSGEKYKQKALDILNKTSCETGEVYVFVTTKQLPKHALAVEQLTQMLHEPVD